jgi:hypothetical protein
MDERELLEARTTIASAHGTLCDVMKTLEEIADEVSGQAVANKVVQAADSIKVICARLRVAGPELACQPDQSVEQDRIERAISEVNSGEYDLQG